MIRSFFSLNRQRRAVLKQAAWALGGASIFTGLIVAGLVWTPAIPLGAVLLVVGIILAFIWWGLEDEPWPKSND